MGGIGKTTLAKLAYADPQIINRFDVRVWVTVSQEYYLRDLLLGVLSCISNEIKEETDDELMDMIYKKLKCQRYLIVMDDIWCNDVWDLMSRTFPDDNNGSRIILTSRLKDVARHADPDCPPLNMSLLNEDESWKLLTENVFGEKHVCPPKLEDIGKQVAQKCQGLPLALLVVAGHLSKIERTQESWEGVAKSVSKVVTNESDKCLGVLAMSYNYLPNHLKPCFLYMGVFPEDSDVSIKRLINLWVSEGFLSEELVGRDCLEDLVSRNLIMVKKRRFNNEARTCGVHDLVRDLILREAEKEKFLLVARIHEATNPSAKKPRVHHYSFHTSMYKADFWESSSSDHLTRTVHFFRGLALLPWTSFKLLRVLAILDFTFQDFPLDITKLVHLRYLEFNCYDDLHWLVSELYNLQTLIFNYRGDKSPTIPAALWEMKHLKHIHISNFFSFQIPSSKVQSGFKLQHLEEISCLCLSCSTSELFSAIPNLKRLKICGNWRECEREEISHCLKNISCLDKLEILKVICHGINQPPVPCKYVLPTSLKRLTLQRTFLPWEDMANITMLPNLELLKIKKYGFCGGVWRLNDDEYFNRLKFLLINRTNLEHLEVSSVNFPILQRLVLKKCLYLEEIPKDIGEICTLESLELHDCSLSAAKSVKEIQEDQESMGNEILSVHIHNCR
ncbi:putative late blight resistance protein homolog R1A-10 [Lycium barbarum]|uniref:putative late blight resistance protein homolog R1A-10 n=1 Tax=Lycium barbarum TaxID=112863 RepID=UPI00293E3083|nr:putative late blight resistance protein homolog R1A-10 [Lycium barbarum]